MSKERIKDEKEKNRISSYQARIIVEVLLHEFKHLPEWKDAFTKRVFPLFTPNYKDLNQYYEVKISTPDMNDAGTVIVSAYKNDYPVQGFKTRGKTFSEKTTLKSDSKVSRIIWQGGNCFSGVDERGKEIIVIGDRQSIEFDVKEFEKLKKKHKSESNFQHKDDIQQEWDELEPYLSRKKTPGNPTLGVEFYQIKGWSRHPNLDQYDLPNGDPIGCGPAAWGQYVSYHDMYWMPDLLYGIYDHINYQYLKKLMKKFYDECGTGTFGIDGFTPPWGMNDGAHVFSRYLLFDNSFDVVSNYDLDVILWGMDPDDVILTKIIDLVDNDEPAIIGLWYHTDDKSKKDKSKEKSGKTGHYCLGMGYSLNTNGKLKFVFVDENHGNGLDDWVWWHRQNIFGVWAIKRDSYESLRTTNESNTDFSSIDMARLDDKIYLIGIRQLSNSDPKLVIRRGSAINFPHPQRVSSGGQNPKQLSFEEEIEISIYDLQGEITPIDGSISVCTWNKREPAILEFKQYLTRLKNFLHIPLELNLISSNPNKQLSIFQNRWFLSEEVPYLFICWRDVNQKIHIVFTVIQDAITDCVFNHVILPERFNTKVDPSIAVAEGEIHTPLLYIAFVNDHPILEDAPGSHLFGGAVPDAGQLLIITLDNFFLFANNEEDIWPVDYVAKVIYEEETIDTEYGPITRPCISKFIENWWVFDAPVSSVNLASNNEEVALLWSSTREYNPFSDVNNNVLKLSIDYSFSSPNEELIARPLGANTFNILKIVFSCHWEPFYDTQPLLIESGYSGIEQVGSIYIESDSRPDILFIPGSHNLLLAWRDLENRLYLGEVTASSPISGGRDIGYLNKYHIVHLLNDLFKTGKNPTLQYVTDTLDNKNFVLGYFHGNDFTHLLTRFLFLKKGIGTNYDDLPK